MTYLECKELFEKHELLKCGAAYIATGYVMDFINTLSQYQDCEFDGNLIYVLSNGSAFEHHSFEGAFEDALYLTKQEDDSEFILDNDCYNPELVSWQHVR